jgi:hypothetical protein
MITSAASNFLVAGLLALLPASAESAGKVHVCVNPSNDTPTIVVIHAEALTSKMFAGAGVAVEWHSAGAAGCQELQQADTVILDFAVNTPPSRHPGALAYAQVYDAVHIVVLFDRVEGAARRSSQVCSILAHVMTHEITHLLEGIARHSETGVMKAQWSPKDFDLMGYGPLPFAPEDVELIRRGLERRATGAAVPALRQCIEPPAQVRGG